MKLFFTQCHNFLATNDARNALILRYFLAYANAGHSIIAVTDRTAHCDFFAEELNKLGIKAEAFHRSNFKNEKAREDCLNRCRSGETQVLIAMRVMVLGVDVPRWVTFMNLLPSANRQNIKQEFSRVRTPFEGKSVAYLVDFEDPHHILVACTKSRIKAYTDNGVTIV
jgi:superfamily II DNA or RNA helicase